MEANFRKPSAYKNLNSTSIQLTEENKIFSENDENHVSRDYCPETESWIGRIVSGISSLVI